MKAELRLLMLTGLFLSMSACLFREETGLSSDVKQDRIYQSYFVTYSGSSNRTDVSATFRFDGSAGTTLQLVGGSGIEHNQRTMYGSEDAWLGGYHYSDTSAGWVRDHLFKYIDGDGNIFQNSVTLYTATLDHPPATLSLRSNVTSIFFSGDPQDSGETIELTISDAEGNQCQAVRFSAVSGAQRFDVYASALARLSPGWKSLKLVRYREVPVQQGSSVGGSISIRYEAAPISMLLTD